MADCTRELVIQALQAVLDTALAAAYGTAYRITRNPSFDPKQIPNGTILLGIYEGAAPPPENGNVQLFLSVPVLLTTRVAAAASEGEYLQQRLNNAEAIVLAALMSINLVAAGRTVGMEVTGMARDVGQLEMWSDITLTLTFPA